MDRSKYCFVYPADAINSKNIDDQFREEADFIRKSGFSSGLISLENIENGISFNSPLIPCPNMILVYRGWMLNREGYSNLISEMEKINQAPLTSIDEYLLVHHLPNWYHLLSDLTADTVIYSLEDNLLLELKKLGWKKYFIKDYVKSLKTSIGSLIESSEDINIVIKEMTKYRGNIEGGICVRRVENYRNNSERRYFVINNKPYSTQAGEEIPGIVRKCSARINSPFYSVDVAECEDGQLRIVEIGDGQVSDLVGWSAKRFTEIWEISLSLIPHEGAYHCKKCNHVIGRKNELIKTPTPWESGGARCSTCGYLYYPSDKQTWYLEEWQKDFEEKKERILTSNYSSLAAKEKEAYRILFLLDSLTKYINYYFMSEIFMDHALLVDSLKNINAEKTILVANKAIELFNSQNKINARSGAGGEIIDDEWEDITYSLYKEIDPDIDKKVYDYYLKRKYHD